MNDGQLPAKVAELVVQLNQFNTLDDAGTVGCCFLGNVQRLQTLHHLEDGLKLLIESAELGDAFVYRHIRQQ